MDNNKKQPTPAAIKPVEKLAAPLPAVDDEVEVMTPADCQVDLDALEVEFQRFIAGMPADEVEIDAVAKEAAAAPLPAVDAVYAEYQRFIAEIAALPPIPARTTIWLSDTLQVPMEGSRIVDDDDEKYGMCRRGEK